MKGKEEGRRLCSSETSSRGKTICQFLYTSTPSSPISQSKKVGLTLTALPSDLPPPSSHLSSSFPPKHDLPHRLHATLHPPRFDIFPPPLLHPPPHSRRSIDALKDERRSFLPSLIISISTEKSGLFKNVVGGFRGRAGGEVDDLTGFRGAGEVHAAETKGERERVGGWAVWLEGRREVEGR